MGKKDKKEMDMQKEKFIDGKENWYKKIKAEEIFDKISAFAGYGLINLMSAYALIAYQCAWLKAHYPHDFCFINDLWYR